MADLIPPDLLPGIGGSVIAAHLDMGDGTYAEMTAATCYLSLTLTAGTVAVRLAR